MKRMEVLWFSRDSEISEGDVPSVESILRTNAHDIFVNLAPLIRGAG